MTVSPSRRRPGAGSATPVEVITSRPSIFAAEGRLIEPDRYQFVMCKQSAIKATAAATPKAKRVVLVMRGFQSSLCARPQISQWLSESSMHAPNK